MVTFGRSGMFDLKNHRESHCFFGKLEIDGNGNSSVSAIRIEKHLVKYEEPDVSIPDVQHGLDSFLRFNNQY